ncbi:YGL041C-like protein [Saccharomyces kudriavzevii IFO 1802]|uniref:YGL041C-like protein n=1 Tax=Saccharomyces kudriavzevii (strain ATCC MYA-4449 / AS 2.2408 / CBS 8840 / NBRC 1802 / NCYC 2889) TaxID=226230 RepID=J5PSS8_SACK1|nr:YGL041C-like protein [Saccharomyces kudriavzevii IFO 1802]
MPDFSNSDLNSFIACLKSLSIKILIICHGFIVFPSLDAASKSIKFFSIITLLTCSSFSRTLGFEFISSISFCTFMCASILSLGCLSSQDWA